MRQQYWTVGALVTEALRGPNKIGLVPRRDGIDEDHIQRIEMRREGSVPKMLWRAVCAKRVT